MEKKLSHIHDGEAAMVNVGKKTASQRQAIARAVVRFPQEVWNQLESQGFTTQKGALLQTANLAGVMGAKQTGNLIPLCHPIGMDQCILRFEQHAPELHIFCSAEVHAKTGIEMEALTGATIAALTVYDMCKALSHDIMIAEVCLMEKHGGKRDFKRSTQA